MTTIGGDPDPELEDTILRDRAEEVEQHRGGKAASQWLKTALAQTMPLSEAMDRYREERQGDLTRSTLDNLLTEKKRFMDWAGEDPALEEVDRAMVHQYLVKHLPTVTTHNASNGLSRATIQRTQTLMKNPWDWAASCGILDMEARNPWTGHRLPKARTIETPGTTGPLHGGDDLARM